MNENRLVAFNSFNDEQRVSKHYPTLILKTSFLFLLIDHYILE